MALRELCKRFHTENKFDTYLPVYINLRDWYSDKMWDDEAPFSTDMLENFVVNALTEKEGYQTSRFIKKYYRSLYANGQFVFLFDSFDEIPAVLDSFEGSKLIDKLSKLIFKFSLDSGCKVILSSREFKQPTRRYFDASVLIHLEPLNEVSLIEGFEKAGFDLSIAQTIFKQKNFRSLVTNPFTFSLIKDFLKNNHHTIPKTQLELYENCIQKRLDTDQLKNKKQVDIDDLIAFAKNTSFHLFKEKKLGLNISIEDLLLIGDQRKIHNFIKIMRDNNIARVGQGSFGFIHRKLQEYFVALCFKDSPQNLPLESIPTNARYRDALVVYCEIAKPEVASEIIEYCWQQVSARELYFFDEQNDSDHSESEASFDRYKKSLSCLRFLIDGFRSRKELIQPIIGELARYISTNLQESNLIVKKHTIEATALLDDQSAENFISQEFKKVESPNSYLLEALADALKYLDKLDYFAIRKLIIYYGNKSTRHNISQLINALSLSENHQPIVSFLKVKQKSPYIVFLLTGLLGLYVFFFHGDIFLPLFLLIALIVCFFVLRIFVPIIIRGSFLLRYTSFKEHTSNFGVTIIGLFILFLITIFIQFIGFLMSKLTFIPDLTGIDGSTIFILGIVIMSFGFSFFSFIFDKVKYLHDFFLLRETSKKIG
ncbi:MAG: hypothetical protein AAF573_01575, partial [Bacteroidota bacterium]